MADIEGLLEKYKKIPGERFFQEIFIDEEYKAVKNEKANVIIDVGALAGEFCAYMHEEAEVIYAIEPNSEHYKELEENTSAFGLTKVKPFHLALSNYNGQGDLVIAVRGGHVLINNSQSTKTERVEVKTLATFMKEQGIDRVDILKIDVENAEQEIFTAPDFETVAKNIACIIGEHLGPVDEHLKNLGFIARNYGINTVYKRI